MSVAALALAAMIVGEVLAVSQSQQSTVKSVNTQAQLATTRSMESKLSPGPPGGSKQGLNRCSRIAPGPRDARANTRKHACLMLCTPIARRALILHCCVCARPQATF